MAIYDDLDYADRWERRWELSSAAEEAAGYPVDVVVTDRPEWKVRTEGVRTSLENRVSRQGVVLVDRPPGVVNWEKEMVMPINDYQEALYRLTLSGGAMGALLESLGPGRVERIEQGIGNKVRAFDLYQVRLRLACGHAHAVAEAAAKALIHLGAAPGVEAWGHEIGKLCDQLAEPHRSEMPPLLEPHGAEAMSKWHVLARYQAEGRGPVATPELVTELARTVCGVASYAADQFDPNHRAVASIQAYVDYVEDYLEGYDLATGQPHRERRRRGGLGLDL